MPRLPSLPENAHLKDLFNLFPQSREALMALTDEIMRAPGELDIGVREMIAGFVSGLNACSFCHESHVIYAEVFGIDPDILDAAINDLDSCPVDANLKPLLAYIAKVNALPARLVQADLDAVMDAGWTEKALFEAVQIAALFNMMNRIVEGAGVSFNYSQDRSVHPTVRLGDKAKDHRYTHFAAQKDL